MDLPICKCIDVWWCIDKWTKQPINYIYVLCLVAQLCPTLVTPYTVVHGILQARILEWIAISSSRGSSRPRNPIRVSYISSIRRRVDDKVSFKWTRRWRSRNKRPKTAWSIGDYRSRNKRPKTAWSIGDYSCHESACPHGRGIVKSIGWRD